MTVCRRNWAILAVIAIVFMVAFAPASARTRTIDHGGTYVGTNVVVPADQVVQGSITVVGGDADIAGTVDGDVTVVGGTLTKEPGSVINGTVNPVSLESWLPWSAASTVAVENQRLMTRLAFGVVVMLAFLLFPVRVRTAMDRIEHHPGLSAMAGVIGIIAIIPIAIVLLISIIGIPLIPVEFIAIFAAMLIGQAALGILLGRRLYELVRPHATPSPLGALILGMVVLSAAEILPFVGNLVTALVVLVGLGATILAFIRESTFMSPGLNAAPAAAGQAGPRPPIGGPPMTKV